MSYSSRPKAEGQKPGGVVEPSDGACVPRLQVSRQPFGDWGSMCTEAQSFFHGAAWQSLLSNALGAEAYYTRGQSFQLDAALAAFRAGPFSIGYIGFPLGSFLGGRKIRSSELEHVDFSGLSRIVDVLRFTSYEDLACSSPRISSQLSYETVVHDLANWSINNLKSHVRSSVKKAFRLGTTVTDDCDEKDAARLYRLYADTVLRHGGNLRYKERYFQELVRLCNNDNGAKCFVARRDDKIIGFNAVVYHEGTVFSLHEAMDEAVRQARSSDLLTNTAITWARDVGANAFNFLSSPRDQQSLVYYKEKWGGQTRDLYTNSVALRPWRAALFNFAVAVADNGSRVMRRWRGTNA